MVSPPAVWVSKLVGCQRLGDGFNCALWFCSFLGQQRRQGDAFRTMRQAVAPELCWPHAAKVCQLGVRSTPRMVLMCKYLHFAVRGSSFLVFVCSSNARWVIVAIVCLMVLWLILGLGMRWVTKIVAYEDVYPIIETSRCTRYHLTLKNYSHKHRLFWRDFCLVFLTIDSQNLWNCCK